jgi:hypothetical protein
MDPVIAWLIGMVAILLLAIVGIKLNERWNK